MKPVIAIAAICIAAGSIAALAQAPSQPPAPTLADVARAEEARRKSVKKPAKVYTNANLAAPDVVTSAPPAATPAPADPPAADAQSPATTAPAAPGDEAPRDQAYWSARIGHARAELTRAQLFADSLQTRINSLKTDFVNRDNRVEREKIEQDLHTALAELEKVKKEIADHGKAIADIEEEARRANVPAGWLRPPS